MSELTITLPDKSTKKLAKDSSALDVAMQISEGLARAVVGAKVNNEIVDASAPIQKDATVQLLTAKDPEGLEIVRHSTAHLLAHAVSRLHPKAIPTIGPVIENGFYYDFDNLEIKEEDLPKIEAEMKKIIKEKLEVTKNVYKNKKESLAANAKNTYKSELIKEFEEEGSSSYTQGEFTDLCRGPHIPSTGVLKNTAFKLEKISAAYWRGNAKNATLTRIYGLSFATKEELAAYLELQAEAHKRDHRKIGKEMKLFTVSPLIGAGLPLFAPKGMIIRQEVENYLWDLHKHKGYSKVWTPHIAKVELYETSGHAEKFGDELFRVKGKEEEFIMKPMNCPHHMQIFQDNNFSYKDLPIRYFEPATIYRDEKSGQLTGLARVRAITQDDGHLFVRFDQIEQEIASVAGIINEFYNTIGMTDYWVSLSVRGDDSKMYLGEKALWDKAEKVLEKAAKEIKLPYKRIEGEAAFYGPKLDFMFKDCLGREWQLATIQCDFNLPERFNLTYTNNKGEKERPVVIHRAVSGSLERFLAILIEHFAGRFPLWLAPVQVKILPIADRHHAYAKEVAEEMQSQDLRAEVDDRAETINKKVREAQLEHVNYILVVGDKEVEEKTVTVRTRDEKVHGAQKIATVTQTLIQEVKERKLPNY